MSNQLIISIVQKPVTEIFPNEEASIITLNNMITNLHIRDIFSFEDDPDDLYEDDLNDIFPLSKDIPDQYNPLDDITIEGDATLQEDIRQLCSNYKDIFCRTVKPVPADVSPLLFDFDLLSRHFKSIPLLIGAEMRF